MDTVANNTVNAGFIDGIESGTVAYFHVDAVPRSMSTILPMALCEAGTVDTSRDYIQWDEPLNWQTRRIGFSVVAERLQDSRDGDMPVTFIEKSTARNVYPATFAEICRYAGAVIFTVRTPEKQMYSLANRIANDQVVGRGADKLSLEALAPDERRAALVKVDEFLAISGHLDGMLPEGEEPYMQPSWREILANYRYADASGVKLAVVDGTRLTQEPETTLRAVCTVTGLPYSPNMPSGWQTGQGEYNKDSTNWSGARTAQGGFQNGWVSRATNSSAVLADITPTLDLTDCPPRMRTYIEDIALPAYQEIIAHPSSNTHL